MASEMLERAANTAEEYLLNAGCQVTPAEAEQCVRAVLLAIREPDEGMALCGYRDGSFEPKDPEDAFTAMIDHMLGEG